MQAKTVTREHEIEFLDKFGDTRVIHRRNGRQTGPLVLKRERVTPAIALNRELGGLVGQRIRAHRIAQGLELAELCERAGIASATPKSRMWEIENAIRSEGVRLGTLYALAMALGVEVCELMPSVDEVRAIADVRTEKRTAVALAKS